MIYDTDIIHCIYRCRENCSSNSSSPFYCTGYSIISCGMIHDTYCMHYCTYRYPVLHRMTGCCTRVSYPVYLLSY